MRVAPNQTQNGWALPAPSQIARNVQRVAQVAIPIFMLCMLTEQVSGESIGECIHLCKEALFASKNNIWTNGFCGAACAAQQIGGVSLKTEF